MLKSWTVKTCKPVGFEYSKEFWHYFDMCFSKNVTNAQIYSPSRRSFKDILQALDSHVLSCFLSRVKSAIKAEGVFCHWSNRVSVKSEVTEKLQLLFLTYIPSQFLFL